MIYVLWNNAYPQPPVAYWLKAFNDKVNPPRPGTTFTVQQINQCERLAFLFTLCRWLRSQSANTLVVQALPVAVAVSQRTSRVTGTDIRQCPYLKRPSTSWPASSAHGSRTGG